MLLLPLGPKGKLPELPVMSITIGLCTIAFSILNFRPLDNAITHSMKHEGFREVHETAETFTAKWCDKEQLTTSDCTLLKKHLSGISLISETDFSKSLEATASLQNKSPMPSKFFSTESKVQRLKYSTESKVQRLKYSTELFNSVSTMPGWGEWKAHVNETYRKGYWLTSENISFVSVLKSNFTHAGWTHLIGNMIFFFAFAGALEMRLGMLAWLVVYLVGGATGLILQATTSLPHGIPLIGASAGISALAGAYLVFFWKHQTKMLFSLVIYNRMILVPTFAFVLFMLAAQDIAGSFETGGSTAHFAHLAGLIFGAVCATIHRIFVHDELPFLYPHELELFETAQGAPEALAIYDQILVWNPENMIVRDLAFAEAVKSHVPARARTAFYKYHLDEMLTQLRRDKDYDRITELARGMASINEFKSILKLLSAQQCVFIVRILLQLQVEDVAERWIIDLPEIHPELKLSGEFRALAAPFTKQTAAGAIGA